MPPCVFQEQQDAKCEEAAECLCWWGVWFFTVPSSFPKAGVAMAAYFFSVTPSVRNVRLAKLVMEQRKADCEKAKDFVILCFHFAITCPSEVLKSISWQCRGIELHLKQSSWESLQRGPNAQQTPVSIQEEYAGMPTKKAYIIYIIEYIRI